MVKRMVDYIKHSDTIFYDDGHKWYVIDFSYVADDIKITIARRDENGVVWEKKIDNNTMAEYEQFSLSMAIELIEAEEKRTGSLELGKALHILTEIQKPH